MRSRYVDTSIQDRVSLVATPFALIDYVFVVGDQLSRSSEQKVWAPGHFERRRTQSGALDLQACGRVGSERVGCNIRDPTVIYIEVRSAGQDAQWAIPHAVRKSNEGTWLTEDHLQFGRKAFTVFTRSYCSCPASRLTVEAEVYSSALLSLIFGTARGVFALGDSGMLPMLASELKLPALLFRLAAGGW